MGRVLSMEPSAAPVVVTLPPALDIGMAGVIADHLLGLRGQAVSLDAGAVERLGGLGLQVLICAARPWGEDGGLLTLANPTEAFFEALTQFGATDITAPLLGDT